MVACVPEVHWGSSVFVHFCYNCVPLERKQGEMAQSAGKCFCKYFLTCYSDLSLHRASSAFYYKHLNWGRVVYCVFTWTSYYSVLIPHCVAARALFPRPYSMHLAYNALILCLKMHRFSKPAFFPVTSRGCLVHLTRTDEQLFGFFALTSDNILKSLCS